MASERARARDEDGGQRCGFSAVEASIVLVLGNRDADKSRDGGKVMQFNAVAAKF